ncbi:MAG: PocR ligand-binding domain-containing protein, partial [Deltaproteobacteria bacterium]|nr:PocR ligand-binding domain-containing protein [Deltaproteobacteria bacterium]
MLLDTSGKDMRKKNGYASLPGSTDLSSWREFQNGISLLLDIPLSLYDGSGTVLVPSTKESPVCHAVKKCPGGEAGCCDMIGKAVEQVLENGSTYVYKCHANQYIFAIPVVIDSRYAFVVVG